MSLAAINAATVQPCPTRLPQALPSLIVHATTATLEMVMPASPVTRDPIRATTTACPVQQTPILLWPAAQSLNACAMQATAAATAAPARLAEQASSRPKMGPLRVPYARLALTPQPLHPSLSALPAALAHMRLRGQEHALRVRPILKVLSEVTLLKIARAMPASAAATAVPARLADQANSSPQQGPCRVPHARLALTPSLEPRLNLHAFPAPRDRMLLRGQEYAGRVRPILKVLSEVTLLKIAHAMPASAVVTVDTAQLVAQARLRAHLILPALLVVWALMQLREQLCALRVRPILRALPRVILLKTARARPATVAATAVTAQLAK